MPFKGSKAKRWKSLGVRIPQAADSNQVLKVNSQKGRQGFLCNTVTSFDREGVSYHTCKKSLKM